jgi:hypothetical protein
LEQNYANDESPLSDVLERYKAFFGLFETFKGYVDFFLLQDLVGYNYETVRYLHPFSSFDDTPLPKDIEEYMAYRAKMMRFVATRGQRMLEWVRN